MQIVSDKVMALTRTISAEQARLYTNKELHRLFGVAPYLVTELRYYYRATQPKKYLGSTPDHPDLHYCLMHSTPKMLSLTRSIEHYAYLFDVKRSDLFRGAKDYRIFPQHIRCDKFRRVDIKRPNPKNLRYLEHLNLHIHQAAYATYKPNTDFLISHYSLNEIIKTAPLTWIEVKSLLTSYDIIQDLYRFSQELKNRFLVTPPATKDELQPDPNRLIKNYLDNPYL